MTSPAASPGERRPWRPIDALYLLFWWIGGAAVGVAVVGDDWSTLELFGVIATLQAAGIFAGVAVLGRTRRSWREALGVRFARGDWRGLLEGAGLQVALSFGLALIIGLLGGTEPTQDVVDEAGMAASGIERIAVIVAVVVLAPVSEELVFRGVLLRGLESRSGARGAVVGSSAAFALVHLLEPNLLLAMPVFFVLGLVLARATIRTGRLGRAITIHAGFNLVTVTAVLFL